MESKDKKELNIEAENEIIEEKEFSDSKEETQGSEDLAIENKGDKKISVFRRLQASIIDQIFVAALSLIGLYIFDGALRLGGFFVSNKIGIYVIVYVIIATIYPPIIESTSYGNTIGKKNSGIN